MSSSVPAAAAAAGFAVLVAREIVPPRRSLAARVRPYAALSKSRLDAGRVDVSLVAITGGDDRTPVGRIVGPVLDRVAGHLGHLFDAADRETLARRLRNAGYADADPDQYRIRQLAHTVGGLTVGVVLGLVFDRVGLAALFMGCFGFYGATIERSRLASATERRAERMRGEVYTIAQLIAVRFRTGSGPVDAVGSVCERASGPVAAELAEALAWISSGTPAQTAYDRLAEATAEPAASRLYRLLAASATTGGDISSSLLSVAEDLRLERKQDLARRAVKRRTAMLVPLLLFITPVMILFVAAALPSLVFGTAR